MIKVKVSELKTAAIDWAVGQIDPMCQGIKWEKVESSTLWAGFSDIDGEKTMCAYLPYSANLKERYKFSDREAERYSPSKSWQTGGPILQEMLSSGKWEVTQGLTKGTVCVSNYTMESTPCDHKSWDDEVIHQYSESVLEAAMKAKVAFEMGEEIEIPEELA